MAGEPKNQPPFTKPKPKPKSPPKPKPKPGLAHRAALVEFSRSLVGIREMPPGSHSNDGPAVHLIQAATGAFRAPWCVSTLQYEDLHVLGTTYADRTASAYGYLEYAQRYGHVLARPVPGCAVIYLVGAGHAGRVVAVHADGSFDAVEGNEGDAVRLMPRNPRNLPCRFVLRPELA